MIDPKIQNHIYKFLGPGYTEPVDRIAACGYRPETDPNEMKSLGGWREIEQSYQDCADCWDIVRNRYGKEELNVERTHKTKAPPPQVSEQVQ